MAFVHVEDVEDVDPPAAGQGGRHVTGAAAFEEIARRRVAEDLRSG
ncbi:hypothetical protein [Umezawaea beigongshangensis]|nr:hypothetical protein [Umezawaea beigongshangensis]